MVVIVGRPNTGKSTLFNRLVGGRIAITLQQPGITRDRIIRETEWLGRKFRIVDTGGLIPDSREEIAREVERQVNIALAESSVIILLTDGSAGLMPMEEEIAARLRRSGRDFIVAANKLDRRNFDPSDFHRLGGSVVVPISAEAGTDIDELLDEVLKRLPPEEKTRRQNSLALAILGRPNVGKSSFMNRVLGRERSIVTAIPGTTRDVVEEFFDHDGRRFRLLDTAGIRRKPKVTEPVEYYSVTRAIDQIERCDVALVMFDVFDGPTNQDKRIFNLVVERGRGMVAVANKYDLVPEEKREAVRDWVQKELDFCAWAPIVYSSMIENRGVDGVLKRAVEVWDDGAVQIPNPELRGALMPRIERRQPRYDCRVLALSQTGTRPPVFRLRLTNPKAMSQAYERFVLGEIRRRFRFTGYPIVLKVTR